MCSILGANNIKDYKKLLKLNRSRGEFAYSHTLFSSDGRSFNTNKMEIYNKKDVQLLDKYDEKSSYFMGHFQAPTGCEREFNWDVAHPFIYGEWIVAHNGVLTSHDYLQRTYTPDNPCRVDTSVIPWMLASEQEKKPHLSEVTILENVLGRLEGTAALWIVNANTHNKYLFRQGSTLYADRLNSTFSSVEFKGTDVEMLPEGTIFLITREGITSVGHTGGLSPFFVL